MIKAVLFDLDGTLILERTPIPGAAEKLEELRSKGVKTLFLTNAATRSRKSVAEKLRGMGLEAKAEEVYCSSYFLAKYISERRKGKKVFIVGERGITDEFEELGVEVADDGADIVVVGLDRAFNYDKLAKALKELHAGAELLASNTDVTFPTEHGLMPGAGSIVAAVEAASGRKAIVLGKPNCYALDLIKEDLGLNNEEILMVGDRLETDIAFAKRCGIRSALLLSGVSKKEDIDDVKPDYVFGSIADFSLP